MSIISSLRRLITVCLGYKKEYPIITMNEIARSVRRRSSLFPSPEKDHCLSCGRKVTVGQMSRHVAHFPGCNVGYSRSRSHSAKKNRRPRKRSKRSDVNDVNDVDDHSTDRVSSRHSSRRSIFAAANSESRNHHHENSRLNAIRDVAVMPDESASCDDFVAMDDEPPP
jgi:hypothetical protein